jgi:hypothetical protein
MGADALQTHAQRLSGQSGPQTNDADYKRRHKDTSRGMPVARPPAPAGCGPAQRIGGLAGDRRSAAPWAPAVCARPGRTAAGPSDRT